MKKYIFLILLGCTGYSYGQKARFSVDIKGNVLSPLGNNFMKDGLKTFTGLGVGFQGIFLYNFGIGVEYNNFFTSVKDESVFGSLHSPTLSDYSIFLIYQHSLSKKMEIEGQIGTGGMTLRSRSDYRSDDFKEHADSFIVGGKILYDISDGKKIQVFASPKLYFYSSDVQLEDKSAEKYYSKATLLNINLGVRFNF